MARLRQTTRKVSQVFKVAPPRLDEKDWVDKFTSNVNKQLGLISEKFGKLPQGISESFNENDYVKLDDLRDELIRIDEADEALVDTEGEEEGDIGGGAGRKRQRRTTRFRRRVWDIIDGAIGDMEPLAAPPNVAAASAIGTTSAASTGDVPRFAYEDHTHGGVLGAPVAGGVAGQVAFFTSSFQVDGDTGLVYDPAAVGGLGALNVEGFIRIGDLTTPTDTLQVVGNIEVLPSPGASQLRFYEAAAGGGNFTSIEATTQGGNIAWVLPAAQGALNTVLRNDGSGNLSWVAFPASTITVQEGDVTVDAAVTTLDFLEPDATLVTSSPAGEANINMALYALLQGRPSTTNDLTLTTDNNGTGSIYGGSDDGAILRLLASSSGSAHTGHIETYLDQLRVRNDLSGTTITTGDTLPVAFTSGASTITVSDVNSVIGFLGTQGTLEYTINSAVDVTLLRNKWNFYTDTAATRFAGMQCVSNTPSFTADGVAVAAGNTPHVGLNHLPSFLTTNGGTITSQVDYAVRDIFSAGAGVTGGGVSGAGIIKYGHYMLGSLTGGGTIDNFYGIFIENFAVGADDCSLVALGSHRMFHLGYARFGNATFTAAAVAGVQVDVFTGFLRMRAGGQVRGGTQMEFWNAANTFHSDFNANASQAADFDYTLPLRLPNSTIAEGRQMVCSDTGTMAWGGWTHVIVKSADQTVTNTTTLADDTELQFTVGANEVWHVELYLGVSGNNATSDAKWGFTASGASFVVAQSNWEGVHYTVAAALTNVAPVAFASTTEAVAGGTGCVDANTSTTPWPVRASYRFRTSAAVTVKVQFALAAGAAVGRNAVMESGSMLLARRIV